MAFAISLAAILVLAPAALAIFSHTATGGPLKVATSKLTPANEIAATQINCNGRENPEVEVTWSATSSSYATSYTVERATASAGPYTSLANVPIAETSYTDQSSALANSTTYYYRVSATYRSWSAASAAASLTTLNKHCR
ncbi:MAG TPA: hypothetical protein VNU24_00160 [Solirubrobacteraceae bacterium]|nr:hypothetical protein [Solirubrobacteraceae bacterium]